jgi:hypothetical protein
MPQYEETPPGIHYDTYPQTNRDSLMMPLWERYRNASLSLSPDTHFFARVCLEMICFVPPGFVPKGFHKEIVQNIYAQG